MITTAMPDVCDGRQVSGQTVDSTMQDKTESEESKQACGWQRQQHAAAHGETARRSPTLTQGQQLLQFAGGTVLCGSPSISSIFADIIQ